MRRTASWLISKQLEAVLSSTTLGEVLEEADYACARLKSLGVIAEATAEIEHAVGKSILALLAPYGIAAASRSHFRRGERRV